LIAQNYARDLRRAGANNASTTAHWFDASPSPPIQLPLPKSWRSAMIAAQQLISFAAQAAITNLLKDEHGKKNTDKKN
jgi:hypothetical protein